ncbi:hypothetical protein N7492_002694 [Penicillium capsulatum]|uniref:Uncharacterized protein n=1 Tax=Penicillium capsulatum TaxID=69766 RepID=A0A9W9LW94_9EURO|nr:hypothetical protein N7492_002694 [Penicillium capsulatum]KAJ6122708.1 hypothetical protein N7512_005173 [Penicillium capsulatum]
MPKIYDRAEKKKSSTPTTPPKSTGSNNSKASGQPIGKKKGKACSKAITAQSKATTSTESKSASTSSSKPKSNAKKICDTNFEGVQGQPSGENAQKVWRDTDMGNLTQSLLDEFVPSVYGKFNQSLPYTIAHQLAGISIEGWGCDADSCDMPDIGDHCEKSNNPYWLFILACLRNFREATHNIIDILDEARDTVSESVHKLFEDLSKPLDVDDTIQVIISAAFSAVSMGLSAVPGVGQALEDYGQVASSIGAYTIDEQITSEEKKNEYADAVQRVLADGVERIVDNIKKYQRRILEDVPANDRWKPYSDHTGSAAQLFRDGSFANQLKGSTNISARHQVERGLYSGAISYVWGSQEIFVAVAKGKFNDLEPCDIDLKGTEIWRECVDGAAYFLVKAERISRPWSQFGDIYGVDKLHNYGGLTLKDVVVSSAIATKANGYRGTFKDGAHAMDYIKGQGTDRLYFNLKTCFIDDMDHKSPESESDKNPTGVVRPSFFWIHFPDFAFTNWGYQTYLREYLMSCENQKDKNGKKFGYGTMCDNCDNSF